MTKTNFAFGTIVTSNWLNAIQTLKFNKDDSQTLNDGEYYRLKNDSLSNIPGQLRYDFYDLSKTAKLVGGYGDDGDFNSIDGAVYNRNEFFFDDFIIPVNHSITFNKFVKIHVKGDVLIDGTLNITPASHGGVNPFTTNYQNLNIGGIKGTGQGADSSRYSWLVYPVGSGGSSGFSSADGRLTGDQTSGADGGSGGGGLIIECAGNVTINGSIFADGSEGTPGNAGDYSVISGCGGGSGGTIVIMCNGKITTATNAVFSADGANGGQGIVGDFLPSLKASGGGGGGAGQIVFYASDFDLHSGTEYRLVGGIEGLNSDGDRNRVGKNMLGGGSGGANGGFGGLGYGFDNLGHNGENRSALIKFISKLS